MLSLVTSDVGHLKSLFDSLNKFIFFLQNHFFYKQKLVIDARDVSIHEDDST